MSPYLPLTSSSATPPRFHLLRRIRRAKKGRGYSSLLVLMGANKSVVGRRREEEGAALLSASSSSLLPSHGFLVGFSSSSPAQITGNASYFSLGSHPAAVLPPRLLREKLTDRLRENVSWLRFRSGGT